MDDEADLCGQTEGERQRHRPEVHGAQEVSPAAGALDCRRLGAKQIAKELAKLFVQQGWIAQEQADKLFWDR